MHSLTTNKQTNIEKFFKTMTQRFILKDGRKYSTTENFYEAYNTARELLRCGRRQVIVINCATNDTFAYTLRADGGLHRTDIVK